MPDSDWLTTAFEEHRAHLRAVAYRLLGSMADADDAVQDTWLRLTGADTSEVANLGGWLTTVVARVSLNMLRSRRRRHEEPVGDSWPAAAHAASAASVSGGATPDGAVTGDPEAEAVLADSVGVALLVVARGAVASAGRAGHSQLALVDGAVGVVYAPAGRLQVVLALTVSGHRIAAIDVIADPGRLRRLTLAVLPGQGQQSLIGRTRRPSRTAS